MGEAFIVRKGGVVSETTAAPTITIISEDPTGVTFTLKNNDDNTAIVTYEIDDEIGSVELAAAATSSNITVALAEGTYTLTAYATVVGEVASSATASVTVQIFEFDLLYDSLTADNGDPITLPATQLDITGLSISKNDELRLVYTFVGDSTTFTTPVGLFPNDNTTQTNYHWQFLIGEGTSLEAGRLNKQDLTAFRSNAKVSGFADIKISNNDRFVYNSYNINAVGSNSSSINNDNRNVVGSGFTLTSITKLTILSSRTNGIAAGSRIRLYKVNTGEA
jgi:hypothetical protein